MSGKQYIPGITFRSLITLIFALLLCAILLQWDTVAVSTSSFSAEHSVPFQAIIVLVLLTFAGAILWALGKIRFLTRAELLCVLFAMLIALPLMTQGFWHRIVGLSNTLTEEPALFKYLGSYPEKLWPHGGNLLAETFEPEQQSIAEVSGSAAWQSDELQPDLPVAMLVLENAAPDEVSTVRFEIPAVENGKRRFLPGEPFVATVYVRPGTAPDYSIDARSLYFMRIYADDGQTFAEPMSSSAPGSMTFDQKKGFRFFGGSSVEIPRSARESIIVEFGLKGTGRVMFARPMLMSNDALVSFVRGKRLVTESAYNQLDLSDRAGLVVKPDNMWSWQGIKFLLTGHIPVRQWLNPVFWWTTLILLILLAGFAVNVLLRRQWMDSERFQMPLTRIPLSLLGAGLADPEPGLPVDGRLPRIWHNRMMWAGFTAALIWTLLRAWHFYNPQVPDLSIYLRMKHYFNDPGYGAMWDPVFFTVSGIFVSLAIFMELNVLLSILVGYFAYRSLWWIGKGTGLTAYSGYPFPGQTQIGAYVMYAVMILFFMRKYLLRVLKAAITGDRSASADEPISYRTALLLLVGCFAGALLWAYFVGISLTGIVILFAFLVTICMVTARIRTECGIPFSYIGPTGIILVLGVFGGLTYFGSETMLFGTVLSFLIGATPFFLIPGAQMELVETGRRFRVKPRHLLMTCILGLVCGMTIGGWVFLSSGYGIGGQNMDNSWVHTKKAWAYTSFNSEMVTATGQYRLELDNPSALESDSAIPPRTWGYVFGATMTAVITTCRQIFPGFWFHPVGFLLAAIGGGAGVVPMIWGSCLVAFVIRLVVLRMAGARAVRTKLQPFFIGVFVGTLAGHLLTLIHATILQSQGVERTLTWWPYLIP